MTEQILEEATDTGNWKIISRGNYADKFLGKLTMKA